MTSKPIEVVGQGEGRTSQAQAQAVDLPHAGIDHARLQTQRYLTVEEAAAHLRFPSPMAFWMWAKRQGIRPCKAGRLNLYLREALERHVEQAVQGLQVHGAHPARPRLLNRTHRAGSVVRR